MGMMKGLHQDHNVFRTCIRLGREWTCGKCCVALTVEQLRHVWQSLQRISKLMGYLQSCAGCCADKARHTHHDVYAAQQELLLIEKPLRIVGQPEPATDDHPARPVVLQSNRPVLALCNARYAMLRTFVPQGMAA